MRLEFEGELFPWDAKPSVVFVALPQDHADAIDQIVSVTGGFRSVKVKVQLGNSGWSTSLFPSKDLETYVLSLIRSYLIPHIDPAPLDGVAASLRHTQIALLGSACVAHPSDPAGDTTERHVHDPYRVCSC